MSGKAMSLKAKIRNIANTNDMSAQVVLQNYMFERLLERLSKSDYKDYFILKGGMLIASIIGIGQRSTMDMDITIKNYPISIEALTNAITEILSIKLDDDVTFSFVGIEPIRDDDIYGGFRISVKSVYFEVVTPLQIDITTGDVITPKEVLYFYSLLLSGDSIGIWAYNIETVLAEKVESILKGGELNTRPRDFYDVYILLKTKTIDNRVFSQLTLD